MLKLNFKKRLFYVSLAMLLGCSIHAAFAAEYEPPADDVLTEEEWQALDQSVEKGLAWLASQQQPDGSFPTMPFGQPGVTALCELAFLSHGHVPDEGEYGERLHIVQ